MVGGGFVDENDDELAPVSPLRPMSLALGDSIDGPIPSAEPSKLAQENAKLKAAVSLMAREMEEIRRRDRAAAVAAVEAGKLASGTVHISRRGSVDVTLGGSDSRDGDDENIAESTSSPLHEKLKEAEDDVQRLADERDRLMEVSNQVGRWVDANRFRLWH